MKYGAAEDTISSSETGFFGWGVDADSKNRFLLIPESIPELIPFDSSFLGQIWSIFDQILISFGENVLK